MLRRLPKYKVEVKNINSFNFAKRAIDYELKRQAEILDSGKTPVQETRGYNEDKGITYTQRSKEEAHDYRYFPEPDIPPLEFKEELISQIRKSIPELPAAKVERYVNKLSIKLSDAVILSRDKKISSYFEDVLSKVKIDKAAQTIANIIVNKKISVKLSSSDFASEVVKMFKPKETDTGKLSAAVELVIKNNPKVVADYKSGKTNAIMFLVGQVMREMKGAADAITVRKQLEEELRIKK